MNNDECRHRLVSLGFLDSEAAAYIELLKKSDFRAADLAAALGIARQKVYPLLAGMVRKGFCTEIHGGTKRFSAVVPDMLFTDLMEARRRSAAERLEQEAAAASEASSFLSDLYEGLTRPAAPSNCVEVLKGFKQINARWTSIIGSASEEILGTMKPPYGDDVDVVEAADSTIGRGVPVRTVYEFSAGRRKDLSGREILDAISRLVAKGEDARIGTRVPIKFSIVDGLITLLQPGASVLVITHDRFAGQMKQLFELLWELSEPIDEFAVTRGGVKT